MNRFYCVCSLLFVSGRAPRRLCRTNNRGIALVTTLLVLSLVTVMSLGIAIALTSQTLIGGFYRNFRGSFYAADSGLNIARQQMVNQLTAGVPSAFGTPPIANPGSGAGGLAANILAGVTASYASSSVLNGGAGINGWKESFKIPGATLSLAAGSPMIMAYNTSTGSCTPAAPCPSAYQYTYNYTLTSVGSAQGTEQATVTENGSFVMNVTGLRATNAVSFAYFGAFVDNYPACLGALVPGTTTGPMFTNDSWEFKASVPPYTSPYIFTDPVGQQSGTAYWWDSGGSCHADPTPGPWGSGNSLVNPNFQAGFQMGQPAVALPTNSFSQEWAVIDGLGTGEGSAAPTAANLSSSLQDVHGSAYTSGASAGVFVDDPGTSATCGAVAAPCVKGGGFYVQGNAQILLQPSGSTAQIYQITQAGVMTTITINPAANNGMGTTVITQGSGATLTLNGVPTNAMSGLPSTMVYVNGNITGLSGPGQGQGAIQDNAMITLTAAGNVTATGDVLYKTEPVTYTQNQIVPGSNPACCSGTPMDTLIPGVKNMNQVLGIYTATGNFDLANTQGNQNIQVDGSIATISQQDSSNCSGSDGGFRNTGGHINAFNNVGGQIQSCIYTADISVENVWFDRRFTARAGFAPPWFPSTSIQQGGPLPTNVITKVQRVQWLNTSAE